MTRSLNFFLILFVVLALPHRVFGDEEYIFKAGEEFHYKILQMGIKSGDATLKFVGPKFINNVDTVLIEFTADGFNFYDKESIYVDPTTFKPLTVERDINIFGKKEKITETYFPQESKIVIQKTVGSKLTEQVLTKSGEVDNIYGFIFRYRQDGNFKPGDRIDVVLPTKDIKMAVVKKIKLKVEGKNVETFYLESKPAQYKLWFDTSPLRLPLRISGAIGLANTVMILKDHKE